MMPPGGARMTGERNYADRVSKPGGRVGREW
jgi:hypothetical protein